MKTNENLLEDDLQLLGLTKNEAKVLITMVRLGTPVEAPKIANLSGVPRSKIYQVLEGLSEKSIVSMGEVTGKANIYRLRFESSEIIEHLQNRIHNPIEKAAERSNKSLAEISNTLQEDRGGIQEVGLIQGHQHIKRVFRSRIDAAEQSIISNITPEFVVPINDSLSEAIKRGVDVTVFMLEEEVERLNELIPEKNLFSNVIGINVEKLQMMVELIPDEIASHTSSNLKSTISSFGFFLLNRPIFVLIDNGLPTTTSFLILKSNLGPSHDTAIEIQNKDFINSISEILNLIQNLASSLGEIQKQFLLPDMD